MYTNMVVYYVYSNFGLLRYNYYMLHALQMLPLLKKSTDNLVAVLGEKATSGESFDALKYELVCSNNKLVITVGRGCGL